MTALLVGYIDPGSAAIVMQVVLAAFLSVGFVFRKVLLAPFVFLNRKLRGEPAADVVTPVDDNEEDSSCT